MSKLQSATKATEMTALNPFASKIDIGSRIHVVAISAKLCDEPVQIFQTFTDDLQGRVD